jgi:hypothetical protein
MCVRSFVRPQHGDNSMGGLNRALALTKARWLCKSHAFVGPSNEALEGYVRSRGGSIHLQMATITIDFSSLSEANAFAAAFFQGGRFFDVSISFTWSMSKKELQTSLQQICKCQPSVLQIEGKAFTVEQGPREYSGDPLAFSWEPGLRAQHKSSFCLAILYLQNRIFTWAMTEEFSDSCLKAWSTSPT